MHNRLAHTINRRALGAIATLLVQSAGLRATPASAAPITRVGALRFTGTLPEADQMSGVARLGRLLIIGVDEGQTLLVLAPTANANEYGALGSGIALPSQGDSEADIEGVTVDDGAVFVIGSHSLKRKEVKPDRTYRQNRERIEKVEAETTRDVVYRLHLDRDTGEVQGAIDHISLRDLLRNDAVLGRFTNIPSKENGVDIEGIAARDHKLYVGFRGPVLRDNLVPVMVVDFDAPTSAELRYVALSGNGIRDLARVEGGFLILSGPVGDGAGGAALYFWDGSDTIAGTDRPPGTLRLLGPIPAPKGGKAEGLAVMNETGAEYTVLVLYDGGAAGAPTLFRVGKSQP